jgi:hypothetical protein
MKREYVVIQEAYDAINHDTSDKELKKIAGHLTRSYAPKGALAHALVKQFRIAGQKWDALDSKQERIIELEEENKKLRNQLGALQHAKSHHLEIAMRACRGASISYEAISAILDEHSAL